MYKKFLYDVQKKIDESQNTTNNHIIDIISKQILRNNAHTTTDNKENADDNGNIKGRKCGKCKQYGHYYAKTCQA
ncbi:hypothetical protein RhiirA5_443857 [Rhizophagus irregularis]|uniref:Uncharacterized protein n=1 Tax=Rhizophagus irregularis TaxID=588596 RepID=A0A2N0R1Z0_9GLOM|nr:hypothetical protein RhiirA5_443857 [Rhizophagus irregularis]PKC57313.1 hypothetical protein RhiirA1_472679 [Rhizophagus irregularis]